MKNLAEHRGKLEIVERLSNSVNGNPRFLLRVGGTPCFTAPDSAHAYTVQNFDGKEVVATIGMHYGKLTINSVEELGKDG